MEKHDITSCRPGNLCRRWRDCPRCAAIRQAQLADKAERATRAENLTWACLDFDDSTKKSVMRSAALVGTGGIWTIERGELPTGRGLHLNLLIDAGERPALTAQQIAAAAPGREVWAKSVPRADVRNVVAYINKRRQHPDPDEYAGRIVGTWGHWRGAAEILALDSAHTPPTVQAMALQTGMEAAGLIPAETPAARAARFVPFFNGREAPKPQLSRQEYRDLADKHLAGLMAIVKGGKA